MISVFLLIGDRYPGEIEFLAQFLLREDALRYVKMYGKEFGISEENFLFYDEGVADGFVDER